MPLKLLSRSLAEPGGEQAHHLHDTGLELTSVTRRRPHQQASCRHLLCLPSQLFRRSRAETPEGSQPAFAAGDLTRRLNPYPSDYGAAFASSLLLYPQPRGVPCGLLSLSREGYGLTTFHGCIKDGLDSTSVSSLRRARILWNSLRHLGRLMDVARALFQIAPVSCDRTIITGQK